MYIFALFPVLRQVYQQIPVVPVLLDLYLTRFCLSHALSLFVVFRHPFSFAVVLHVRLFFSLLKKNAFQLQECGFRAKQTKVIEGPFELILQNRRLQEQTLSIREKVLLFLVPIKSTIFDHLYVVHDFVILAYLF